MRALAALCVLSLALSVAALSVSVDEEERLQPPEEFFDVAEPVGQSTGMFDESHPEHAVSRGEMRFADVKYSDYDSGGCTPLTVWEDWCRKHNGNEWWDWEKRLPDLAQKVASLSGNDRAAAVHNAIGQDYFYLMYIDGRSHDEGANAFGKEYIQDMTSAHNMLNKLMKNKGLSRETLNMEFYDNLHSKAFKQSAGLLKKKNGFRGANSWIYLPMPDKPLGVYHNVHYKGKLNHDQNLRIITKLSEHPIKGWLYNRGYQLRWRYPNLDEKYSRQKVQQIFDYFWSAIGKIPSDKTEAQKRAAKLTAITWLYHALENFHCFIDGNGRTNVLVMQALLCWAGLHPVSFYNSMESALASWEEEREIVLEGYLKWETGFSKKKSGWTRKEIDRKKYECQVAVDKLLKPRTAAQRKAEFMPDTEGGCMCTNQATCEKNELFADKKWCYTDAECIWGWDYCAEGRSSKV